MSTTRRLNFSIAVNPIPLSVNLVLIYSYVIEKGRLHDKIANPVCGSGWRGFGMFHAVMFVAAVALVAIPAVILFVIPKAKDRSNCNPIGDAPSLPTDNAARLYQNNGAQILSGAINTAGDVKGNGSGSIFINKWTNLGN